VGPLHVVHTFGAVCFSFLQAYGVGEGVIWSGGMYGRQAADRGGTELDMSSIYLRSSHDGVPPCLHHTHALVVLRVF
jgi:hypothetical protein